MRVYNYSFIWAEMAMTPSFGCFLYQTHVVSSYSSTFQMSSSDSDTPNVDIKYTQIFINNEWHKAANGKTFPVINPSTGEEICQVEEGTRVCTHTLCSHRCCCGCRQADVDKAVEAARKAFDIESPWRKLEPAARGNLMRKFAALLRRDVDYLSVRYTLLPVPLLTISLHSETGDTQ